MSFLLFKTFTGFFQCQHPLGSLFFATQLLFISHAISANEAHYKVIEKAEAPYAMQQVPLATLPYTDTTNFDNSSDSLFLSKQEYLALQLNEVFPYLQDRDRTTLVVHKRIELSDSVTALIVKNYLSENELESRLITYKRGVYRDAVISAYDEIAESAFRKESIITDSAIVVTSYDYFEEPPKITKETSVITADGAIVGK